MIVTHPQLQPRRRVRHGQIIILFQLSLIVFLAFAGFVIDLGMAYFQRRRMQTAADAAALAAIHEYGFYPVTEGPLSGEAFNAVNTVVAQYTAANHAQTFSWDLDTAADRLEVVARFVVDTFFLRLVGIDQIPVSAVARASVSSVGAMGNLIPIALTWPDRTTLQQWISGTPVEVWAKDTNATVPPGAGNFGWLDWDGTSPSADELAENLLHPENSGPWAVDEWAPGGPGVTGANEVKESLDELVRRSVYENKHFYIIGYEVVNDAGGQNFQYQVAGFIAFRILDYDFSGQGKVLHGEFVKTTIQATGQGRLDLGLRAATLVD